MNETFKTMQETLIRYIAENPDRYLLRMESMSFLIIIRKSDNTYINVYGSYEDIEYVAGLLEKHPILLGD